MFRFDRAIVSYHRALAIRPKFTFCSDMLSRAMDDMSYFPTVQGDTLGSGDPTGSPSRDNRHVPLRSAASRDDTDGGGKLLRGSLITSTPDLSVVNSFSNIAWRLSIGSDLVNAPVFPESPF